MNRLSQLTKGLVMALAIMSVAMPSWAEGSKPGASRKGPAAAVVGLQKVVLKSDLNGRTVTRPSLAQSRVPLQSGRPIQIRPIADVNRPIQSPTSLVSVVD